MTDKRKLRSLLDNEKEWRRFLIQEVGELRHDVTLIKSDVSALKVWSWLSKSTVATIFAAFGYLFNKHIGGK